MNMVALAGSVFWQEPCGGLGQIGRLFEPIWKDAANWAFPLASRGVKHSQATSPALKDIVKNDSGIMSSGSKGEGDFQQKQRPLPSDKLGKPAQYLGQSLDLHSIVRRS